ncbi:hypothetical protein Vadar_025010 [Vaccinium darrowii]|uniref:Uncharacterized protein n=1 Tax=Vaccinium darrowii TaxID=229202 RepID=A0ACB7YRI1_9ERIC|nr:hypothetical protein Vadar_025010 [Vaccinium darrowii]
MSIDFPATNNEAEYETLIAGLRLALNLSIEELQVYSDSILVISQLNSDFSFGDSRMLKYLSHVLKLQEDFKKLDFWHISRASNAHADALAALGSACSNIGGSRTVILGDIPTPSFEPGQGDVICITPSGTSWMDPLIAYLQDARLPTDNKAAHRVRCQAASYFLSATGQLYMRTYIGPDLRVLHEEEIPRVLHELHEGMVEISHYFLSLSFFPSLNVTDWEFMMCLGFLGVACVRAANELGRGDAKAVKFSIKVNLGTSIIIGLVFFIICLLFGHDIGYLFTSNEEVAETVAELSVSLAFTMLFNSIQPMLSGVTVGAGLQGTVAIINLCSYYVIGEYGSECFLGWDCKSLHYPGWYGELTGTCSLEFWYNSILVLIAGYIPDADIAISAFSICLNVSAWQFMIFLGFLGAGCVHMANELGRGDANAVKFSIKVLLSTTVTLGPLRVTCLQPVITGVAVGAGLQGTGAIINLYCFYVIGIPLGVLLPYVADLEVKGIWIGMLSGMGVQILSLAFMVWRTDRDLQVNKASKRLGRWFVKPSKEPDESLNHA